MSVYESLSESQQFACRVIADHARSTAFAIADGILPGNEGRNYVLRKIMRRAIYHGREHLGFKEAFFYKVCDFVIDQMHQAYPELEAQRDFIGKMVRLEEERFGNTLIVGLAKLDELFSTITEEQKFALFTDATAISSVMPDPKGLVDSDDWRKAFAPDASASDEERARREEQLDVVSRAFETIKSFSAEERDSYETGLDELAEKNKSEAVAFYRELAKLYDTFGTPRDLIRVKLEEFVTVPISEEEFSEKFDAALSEIQKQSGIGQTERKAQISPVYAELLDRVGPNKFHGYETTQLEGATVAAILDGDKPIDTLSEGQQGSVILNETPFYAESGGQVGDTGRIVSADASQKVSDTYSPMQGLIIHKVTVEKGSIKIGDEVVATVDAEKRDATRRNHTATHLVHAALKEVLGGHVKQAGSVVAPNYLRFDFTHYQPMTEDEIREIESLVNRYILENHPVNTSLMAIEEAMRGGAVALFGEKYGSEVRVLSVGEGTFSKELCGGTHVRATGDIGSFKIISDEAIASGVRRIRAITGVDAFERFREDERLIDRSLAALKTQRDQLPNAIERLQDELKRTRREIEDLKLKIATGAIGGAAANGDETKEIAGVKVLAKTVEGLDANGTRQLSDTLLARLKSGVVVLGRKDDGKVGIIVRVSNDLTDKVKAGSVIKEIAPIVGGKGGGKPDMAEGGGNLPDKLSEAMDTSLKVIENMLG
jgi:alanyl-tRNA synthetase